MAHYFLELPQGKGRADAFLARNATLQNGTYAEILARYAHALASLRSSARNRSRTRVLQR